MKSLVRVLSLGVALLLPVSTVFAEESAHKVFSVETACFQFKPIASIRITGQKGVYVDGLFTREDNPGASVAFTLTVIGNKEQAALNFACRTGEMVEIDVPTQDLSHVCRCH